MKKIGKILYKMFVCFALFFMIWAVIQKVSNNRFSIGGIKIFTVITGSMIPVYVGAGVMVLSAILADVLLRCPACGKPLLKYKMHSIPRFCSNCGEPLKED